MRKIPLLILFSLLVVNAVSQSTNQGGVYENVYTHTLNEFGIDQVLVNGVTYENRYFRAEGHPFLGDDVFYSGELLFRGKLYTGLRLKYDIFEQQLVINYLHSGKEATLIVPNEFISSFRFNNKYFIKHSVVSPRPAFVQVLGAPGSLQCLYSWEKTRSDSEHLTSHFSYQFSRAKKNCFLFRDGTAYPYSGNSSFIKLFSKSLRPAIKNYMKKQGINMNKSDDKAIEKLLAYCFNLEAI